MGMSVDADIALQCMWDEVQPVRQRWQGVAHCRCYIIGAVEQSNEACQLRGRDRVIALLGTPHPFVQMV